MQTLIGAVAALALSITPLVAAPTSSAKPAPDGTTTYILPGYQCVFPEGVEVWGEHLLRRQHLQRQALPR